MTARLPDDQLSPNAMRQRKYRENPESRMKGAIRSRVNHALGRGWITKQPCICGSTQVEAHHANGYDLEHALDVVWLCKKHHEVIHPHRSRPRKAAA